MEDFNIWADLAQTSLGYFFYNEDKAQFINNVYPLKVNSENDVFNYWWIAHLVDVRIDAYIRTKDLKYLHEAERTYKYNKDRNNGTLIHEYYDDMLWNALAGLRLFKLTNNIEYYEDAKEVCDDIINTAWNEVHDGGFAWKRSQMSYKNTPVNAPMIILLLRLHQLEHNQLYLDTAKRTLVWLQKNLVNPVTQFIEDGVNRNNDGLIDTDWKFTYNQGVYIGALLEFYKITGESSYLEDATQCARTSLKTFVKNGVFKDSGDGGDIGLFKGILYRYLGMLYSINFDDNIRSFIFSSCTVLVNNAHYKNHILAYRDWACSDTVDSVYLSDQLSAVMALEVAAFIS